jgi:acetyl-CoA carboxylase biotin carboxyl carrier protein
LIPIETFLSLIQLLEEHQLETLSITTPVGKFTVSSQSSTPMLAPLPVETLHVPSTPLSPEAPAEEKGLMKVVSPLSGVFYRSPSPGAPPFVEVGDDVSPGDVLCIVEAMKVMNEIVCETHGTVEKILPQNGDVVEPGAVLFLIRPHQS